MNIEKNDVDVCYKDICVKAKGKNADLLIIAVAFVLACAGVNLLAKAIR